MSHGARVMSEAGVLSSPTAQAHGKGQPSAKDRVPQNTPRNVAGKARSSAPGRKAAEVRVRARVTCAGAGRPTRLSPRGFPRNGVKAAESQEAGQDTRHLGTRGLSPQVLDICPQRQTPPFPP